MKPQPANGAPQSRPVGTPRHTPACALAAVVAYGLLVAAFQFWSGADGAAFGGYADEPSHYLSGLMVRDYVARGLPGSPLVFATNYYVHMPFVAIGYWPPLFYGIEGGWMMAFGYQRTIVLWLPALAAALLSGTCFRLLAPYLGHAGAFLFGLLFLLLPAVQWSNRLIMVDTTFTLLSWWAALAFGHWVKTNSRLAALAAGFLAAAALLTKINSVYLFVLPILLFSVTRGWSKLREASFWIIPAVVVALWGPWILVTHSLLGIGFGGLPQHGLSYVAADLGGMLLKNLLWFAPVAVLGAVYVLRRERKNPALLICAILPFCYAAFLAASRVQVESRFLVTILAPAVVLAGIGTAEAAARLARPWLPAGLLGLLLAAIGVGGFAAVTGVPWSASPPNQVRPMVDFLCSRSDPRQASVLVPSNAEGPFIAEFAMRDKQRPARLLVRPLKLLATVDWNLASYRPRFHTCADLVALFDSFPVRYIVVPTELHGPGCYLHDQLLKEMLRLHPERWTLMAAWSGPWQVYERTDGRTLPPAEMEAAARKNLSTRLHDLPEMGPGRR